MGIKTVPQPPYSPDLALCDFWLFPKLRGCRYERIEEMKEAMTKVIDTLTQSDFHGAFQKLLERYNKCIAARGDYFEEEKSLMCVLSIKVPIRKSLETYQMHLVQFNKILVSEKINFFIKKLGCTYLWTRHKCTSFFHSFSVPPIFFFFIRHNLMMLKIRTKANKLNLWKLIWWLYNPLYMKHWVIGNIQHWHHLIF